MLGGHEDPTTAQFLPVDPMVSQTMSPYAYVRGNPLNAVDPIGTDPWWNDSQATWSEAQAIANNGGCSNFISPDSWQNAQIYGSTIPCSLDLSPKSCVRLGGGNWTSNDTNGCQSTLSSSAGIGWLVGIGSFVLAPAKIAINAGIKGCGLAILGVGAAASVAHDVFDHGSGKNEPHDQPHGNDRNDPEPVNPP